MILDCAGYSLDLGAPRVMGVLNVTPDSFSDGGRYASTEAALEHARQLVSEGADIIDVGGESTRPGAAPVSVQEELDRVLPVIEALRADLPILISIDTRKPEVMRSACAAGAGFINDVSGFESSLAIETAVETGAAICIMHMQGEPQTMQHHPDYDDVESEVLAYLVARAHACEAAGVRRERIVLDPGFGFGKSVEHNLQLLRGLSRFSESGYPVLAGLSRKSMIGALLDRPVEDRLWGSLALAAWAVREGASIIRTHDVEATVDMTRMTHRISQPG